MKNWTVRVFVSQSVWYEWEKPDEAAVTQLIESLKTKGFHVMGRGGKKTHYLPAGIVKIETRPPRRVAEVSA